MPGNPEPALQSFLKGAFLQKSVDTTNPGVAPGLFILYMSFTNIAFYGLIYIKLPSIF
jgi:hypothetical protein